MRLSSAQCWTNLAEAAHGVLSTVNRDDIVDAVPVCFAVVGQTIVSPVDRIKPKENVDLARVRNARHRGTATLLCEHWDADDWSQLWWVRAHLHVHTESIDTAALETALRRKYRQYRQTEFADLLVFEVERLVGWTAGAADQLPR